MATAVPVNMSPVSSFVETSDWGGASVTTQRHPNHVDSSIHESRLPLLTDDVDEDKLRSKSASEFLFRWLRNRRSLMPSRRASLSSSSSSSSLGRYLFPGIIGVLVLFALIHFFLKFGRQSADADVSLNPAFNPNIRNRE